ncbi:MAG: phosphoribosylformylglycinamidine synthase [Patescibacteria group bacterium]|nr:phosphoribosylformylglycinamidine synthase [Patescibacteria group bacterium]
MAIRIDVIPTIPDARAAVKLKAFRELAGAKVRQVYVADSYLIDTNLTRAGLLEARAALANPNIEKSYTSRWLPKRFSWGIEIGFLPGVTDNVGATAKETIADAARHTFKEGEHVYSSQTFFIEGAISRAAAEKIAASLYNPLIQTARVFDTSIRKERAAPAVPRVSLAGSSRVLEVDLAVSDAELEILGKEGIEDENGVRRGPLGLSVDYLKAIRAHYLRLGRKPTDIELETLAQTWSEHCKHTIFASPIPGAPKGLYKTYIKGATEKIKAKRRGQRGEGGDFCVSVFKDNSGGIVFDDEYVVTHKVETHNTPSALDPFGGAITGIVGVNRDALGFGLGAKPVANVYGFCFAPPTDTRKLYRDKAQTQEMLSARRIADGVIKGINAGGNQSGIPTPHGFMLFDDSYRGKPLVFAGTVGLIPKKDKHGRKLYEKKAQAGDYIVMVGGRVGADGIHGATFSSGELHSGSPATAVQIGDPITQKKFSDAIAKEARDMGLYNSITDDGAGGLSSSVGEMANEAGGCRVDLEKVPLKYPGLEPWQIWISESQERMTLAVPKGKWRKFADLMKRRGVEATIIGEYTKSGKCVVEYNGTRILDIGLDFLHDGVPICELETAKPGAGAQPAPAPKVKPMKDYSGALSAMLSRFNLASQEFLARQFDHEVQDGSVVKPVQGAGRVTGDAGVFKPVLSSPKAVVLSSALTPFYMDLDPYLGAAAALDAAVRQSVAAGASLSYLAILDNFCWTESNKPERLWQLHETARACHDYAISYGTPFISGKDSMFNDFKGYDEKGEFVKISALPTLVISTMGVIDDAERAVTIDPKFSGDFVYLIGETHDELGGSEYFRMISEHGQKGAIGGAVPKTDAKKNLRAYRAFEKAVAKGLAASAISVGRGGLAIALSKMAMSGTLGIEADISKLPGTMIYHSAADGYKILFSESQGRILATVAPENAAAFEKIFAGQAIRRIGTVVEKPHLTIASGKKKLVSLSLKNALAAYRKTFKDW